MGGPETGADGRLVVPVGGQHHQGHARSVGTGSARAVGPRRSPSPGPSRRGLHSRTASSVSTRTTTTSPPGASTNEATRSATRAASSTTHPTAGDFQAEKTREKHGRKKRFRQLISGMPTGRLRARLTSMADATGIAIIAVDPAYTSKWGAQHWLRPMAGPTRKATRHDAAGIAIGRRAQGHPIRRRTTPPRAHQSDVHGHRTAQPGPETLGREGPRPYVPGPRTRSVPPDAESMRTPRTPKTVRDVRSDQAWVQHPLLLTQ